MLPNQLKKGEFRFVLLKSKSKVPFENEWQKNGHRFDDPKLLKHIEEGGNYGVIGGYGNLRILDIDDKIKAEKLLEKLPKTFKVITGGGGYHNYFISDYDKNHVLVDGIGELRSNNYQVVGAGSMHPNGISYKVIEDIDIASISSDVMKALLKDFLRPEYTNLNQFKDTLDRQKDDSRSAKEYRECIKLIYNNKTKEEIFNEMKAFKKWTEAPEQYRELTYNKALSYVETKKRIGEDVELELITVKHAIENGVPEIKYIIDPFVREGGLTIIGGEPGCKKSMLAQYLSICIAKGKIAFDKFKIQQRKVCYLDFENGYIVMVNRFNSLLHGNFTGNKEFMEDVTLSVFNDIKLDNSNSKISIRKIIDQTNADVFIIDSLVRCMEGEEDKATDVRKVFDNLKDFMAEGKTFVILHHTRKENNRGMSGLRGSSDLGGMAEIVLMLSSTKEGNFTYCTMAKHRHLGIDNSNKWGFMIDDELFGEGSNYIKLKYFDVSPEDKTKFDACLEELEQWIDENYSCNEIFKTDAANKAMDKLGGYNRVMVADCIKKHLTNSIIKKTEKRGFYEVQ